MIYVRIKNNERRDQMPRWVLKKLEEDYLTNTGRNLLLQQSIHDLVQKIDDSKLNAFLVRGATFLDQVYKDNGVRPIMDMDIVVDEKDFEDLQNVLQGEGFEWFKDYPYFYKKGEFYVDVHLNSLQFWRLNWPTPIRITNEDLWRRTLKFEQSLVVRQLDCYDHILHCCEHLMRHNYEKLMWFMDIAYMIESHPSFQWDELYTRAEKNNFLKPLFYVFTFLAHHELCAVKPSFYGRLENIHLNPIEKRSIRLLRRNRRRHFCGEWLAFFMIKGWSKRWQLFYYGVFIKKSRLPLVRQKFLVWSYMRRLFKFVFYQFLKLGYFLKP